MGLSPLRSANPTRRVNHGHCETLGETPVVWPERGTRAAVTCGPTHRHPPNWGLRSPQPVRDRAPAGIGVLRTPARPSGTPWTPPACRGDEPVAGPIG